MKLSSGLGSQGTLRNLVMMRKVVIINCNGASTHPSMSTAKLIIFSILPITLVLLGLLKYHIDIPKDIKGASG